MYGWMDKDLKKVKLESYKKKMRKSKKERRENKKQEQMSDHNINQSDGYS